MAKRENLVQGAIAAALEVYCDRNFIYTDLFEPYAVQQGVGLGRYCADLLGRIGNSKILLLEVKEVDRAVPPAGPKLPTYDPVQHLELWDFEDIRIPIHYAYAYADAKALSYLASDRDRQWPNTTLLNVYLCKPSELLKPSAANPPGAPELDMASHGNLLYWLLTEPDASASTLELVAYLLGKKANELRNRIIIVASVSGGLKRISSISASAARELLEPLITLLEGKWQAKGSKPDQSVDDACLEEIAPTLETLRSLIEKIKMAGKSKRSESPIQAVKIQRASGQDTGNDKDAARKEIIRRMSERASEHERKQATHGSETPDKGSHN